ncbi:MAG: malonyl-CoA decarboxylase [Pseudomonadota bacterium]
MTLLADLLSTVFERRYRPSLAATSEIRDMPELTADLIGAKGEVSGLSTARQILGQYAASDDDEKLAFFRHLAEDLSIVPEAVRTALEGYQKGQSKRSYRALMDAAEPPRQELIRRLNQVPGATKALVAMRADLLRLGRGDDALEALDIDFRHLLASWFNRGFLVLRPINWQSPAQILDKIIAYEAVHAIDSWDDLRLRLEPIDRRCFAFFHPAMPDEPLIFVEVALTKGTAGSIHELLSADRRTIDAEEADTAVFYSISNCQEGLAGISFGNSLIKQVAADLSLELPLLTQFVTLSPIPGLVKWLEMQGHSAQDLAAEEALPLAAAYLVKAKRSDGMPLDPVARFHLGNGALVHKLHTGADLSEKGRRQSGGIMVNYLYDLKNVSQNHERFSTSQEVIASPEIEAQSAAHKTSLA